MNPRQALPFIASGLMFLLGCTVDEQTSTPDPNATHIGLLVPITGLSTFGRDLEDGSRFAISEINAAGGVNGKSLDVVVRDDKLTVTYGIQGARELIGESCVGIVGPVTSSELMQVAQSVTIAAGIPIISPSATSPAITSLVDHGTVWRTEPSDAFQGVILANQIRSLGISDVGVIYVNDVYGSGLAAAFQTRFQSLGGMANLVPYADGKTSGFSDEVSRLFGAGVPAGVVIIGYVTDSANITRDIQLANPMPKPQFFGVDGNYDTSFLANCMASVVEGMHGTAPNVSVDSPNYKTFATNYRAAAGAAPPVQSENAYDAVYLMALAMARGRANTREAVRENLRDVSRSSGNAGDVVITPGHFTEAVQALKAGQWVNYEGASGKIDFDVNGDVTSGTYLWWKVVESGGKLVFETESVITFP